MIELSERIFSIEAIRRNHALEHAAVTVLLERFGFSRSLAGRSNARGFSIYGDVSTAELQSAVNEGLTRLRSGERSLAVSPFCGTNIAVTGILAGLATLALVGKQDRIKQMPNVLLGGMVAVFLGQPLGRFVQQHITTSPNMSSMRVESITVKGWGPFKGHWVETSQT